MAIMLATLDTSHLEMSPLKDYTRKNMANISATRDTSQFETSPSNAITSLRILLHDGDALCAIAN